uniref:Survivin n=1 Tax=Leptobrachium leishanense TaxID=445787 RepID=A0A8C5W869_9ANUR
MGGIKLEAVLGLSVAGGSGLGVPELSEEWKLYILEVRVQTLSNWPFTEDCICMPEIMAQCFFCLKELEGWESEDDPMKEHCKHSPSCHFISLKKAAEELTLRDLRQTGQGADENQVEKKKKHLGLTEQSILP